ncbi:MAG: FprA family A-type flavoprotein [Actinobacteria bacterium]|nr:MAG: FprA family A-type flavoprotein [Actinomycetota bacterium]
MPLGVQIAKTLEKVAGTGGAIDTIAPSHGVGWRGADVGAVLAEYGRLAAGETRPKVVVAYSTMWGSTDAMARAITDGVAQAGAEVAAYDLAASHLAQVTRDLLDARVLLLGSPTLHHGMLYRTAGYLQYLAGLKPAGKVAGVFGSFGWSSGATKQMTERLAEIGIEPVLGEITLKYRPTADDLAACIEFGRAAGRAALEG